MIKGVEPKGEKRQKKKVSGNYSVKNSKCPDIIGPNLKDGEIKVPAGAGDSHRRNWMTGAGLGDN